MHLNLINFQVAKNVFTLRKYMYMYELIIRYPRRIRHEIPRYYYQNMLLLSNIIKQNVRLSRASDRMHGNFRYHKSCSDTRNMEPPMEQYETDFIETVPICELVCASVFPEFRNFCL